MLARVDGKSPVEYLTDAGASATRCAAFARALLQEPVAQLANALPRVWRLARHEASATD